jgi:hypothetical protein
MTKTMVMCTKDGALNKMEEKKKSNKNGGKTKIILGSLSILTVFSTPYLHITQISFNMNLFQSAAYSFLLLSFWLFASSFLKAGRPTHESIEFPSEDIHHHRHHHPAATA